MSATTTSAKASTPRPRRRSGRCSAPRPRRPRASPTTVRTACFTPESYLGFARIARNGGEAVEATTPSTPTGCRRRLADNELAFGGAWKVEGERAIAGRAARLRLDYRARDVYLVLTGTGSVRVLVDGKAERTVRVTGDRLYTLVERPKIGDHLLELRFSPSVAAYAFTFG